MGTDLDTEDSKEIIYQDLDLNGNPAREEIIIILTFDLYNLEVGDGNDNDRVTTFAYEIRSAPKKSYMLKIYFVQYLQKILTSSL